MSSKDEWSLESALKVLQHPTVDARTWAEAVEWLLRYGPKSIRNILLEASNTATEIQFPEVTPSYYTKDGHPVYDVKAVAEILSITESEARQLIRSKENPADSLADLAYYSDGLKTVH